MSLSSIAVESTAQQQYADQYASRGWHVFPVYPIRDGRCSCGKACDSPGKHPRTLHGCKDATTDSARIATWWSSTLESNIGIATGPISGFWVLDADKDEGIQDVQELEKRYGKLPRTPTVKTGRGRHYYFKVPSDVVIKNTTKLCGKSVDVRGDQGYVLAPPSNHITGKDYVWEVKPDDVSIAEAPGWLIEIVTKKVPWPETAAVASIPVATLPQTDLLLPSAADSGVIGPSLAIDNDLGTAPGVGKGKRHDHALKLVGTALARGKPLMEVEAEALQWAARCQPPLPVDEIQRIVVDLSAKHQAAQVAGWEPPLPFNEFVLPAFPTDTLPSWLQTFVDAEAEATQTPPDMVAMLSIATVAAAAAKKVEVAVKNGYSEPINIFTVTALPPANRKSAVFSDVTAPLREFEADESKRLTPEIAEASTKRKIDESTLDKVQRAAAAAEAPDKATLTQEAIKLSQELAQEVMPTAPRLVAADTTPEKLATLLQENHGRMAVMSPEGDVFDLMAGRYGNRGTPNFGIYLNGHAGDDLRVDRVGRPGEFVTKPALTLGLVVQPDVIHGLADRPGFRGRGLLGRFLYSLPVSLVGRRNTDPATVPEDVRESYRQKLLALVKLPFDKDQQGVERPYYLQLSPEAKQLYLWFARQVEPMLSDFGQLGAISDWGGKLVGAVVRIAGILHMAAHAGEELPWAMPIARETMENAILVGEYLIPHAKATFAQMSSDPVIEEAKYVLHWMQRKAVTSFNEREVFDGTKGHFRKVVNLRPALSILVEHGYLRPGVQPDHKGRGRKPSPSYEVNPQTHSQNSHKSQPEEVRFDSANSANNAKTLARSAHGDEEGMAEEQKTNSANCTNSANTLSRHDHTEPPMAKDQKLNSANCANSANTLGRPQSHDEGMAEEQKLNSANCANSATTLSRHEHAEPPMLKGQKTNSANCANSANTLTHSDHDESAPSEDPETNSANCANNANAIEVFTHPAQVSSGQIDATYVTGIL